MQKRKWKAGAMPGRRTRKERRLACHTTRFTARLTAAFESLPSRAPLRLFSSLAAELVRAKDHECNSKLNLRWWRVCEICITSILGQQRLNEPWLSDNLIKATPESAVQHDLLPAYSKISLMKSPR